MALLPVDVSGFLTGEAVTILSEKEIRPHVISSLLSRVDQTMVLRYHMIKAGLTGTFNALIQRNQAGLPFHG